MSSGKVNAWPNETSVDLSLVHFSVEVTEIIKGNWFKAQVWQWLSPSSGPAGEKLLSTREHSTALHHFHHAGRARRISKRFGRLASPSARAFLSAQGLRWSEKGWDFLGWYGANRSQNTSNSGGLLSQYWSHSLGGCLCNQLYASCSRSPGVPRILPAVFSVRKALSTLQAQAWCQAAVKSLCACLSRCACTYIHQPGHLWANTNHCHDLSEFSLENLCHYDVIMAKRNLRKIRSFFTACQNCSFPV